MMRFDARYDRGSDTLTLSVDEVPVDANLVTTPRGLRLTVNDDATQLYRVEIPSSTSGSISWSCTTSSVPRGCINSPCFKMI